jgi:hypothetical protein
LERRERVSALRKLEEEEKKDQHQLQDSQSTVERIDHTDCEILILAST